MVGILEHVTRSEMFGAVVRNGRGSVYYENSYLIPNKSIADMY